MTRDERLRLFVACAPGLEPLLTEELEELGVEEPSPVAGGVSCFGDRSQALRLNLGCGLGLRVLVRVAEFVVRDFRKLERVARATPWEQWLAPGLGVRVRAHSKRSRLYHTTAIAERVERGIAARLAGEVELRADAQARGPGGGDLGESTREPTLVQVRIARDRCTISVDTTGPLLHKRGWRPQGAKAPLREDIARALLRLSGWRPRMALWDPLAGSGTLVIEAATVVAGLPPGAGRRFACDELPGFDGEELARLREQLRAPSHEHPGTLLGSDRNAGAVELARTNAARAGVEGRVSFVQRSVGDTELPELEGHGIALVTNPPWGKRTGDPSRLRNLYASLGKLARRLPRPVHVGLVTPEAALAHATGLEPVRRLVTRVGGVEIGLWTAVLTAPAGPRA